jgi:GntR family transcriptional regulator
VGQSLPPERELATAFGVSLAPVRQAILDLVKEGVLYRVRGKGTFLRERSLFEQDAMLSSFTENLRSKGLAVAMHVLRAERAEPPREVAQALQTRQRRVWWFERLAVVEGEPTALLTSFLSARRFPGLPTKLSARGSLYRVIVDDFSIVPTRADTMVEVAPCPSAQAEPLGVPAGSSVLVASGTTYGVHDVPVEHFRCVYRGDRIRLRLATNRYAESVISEARHDRARRMTPRGAARDGFSSPGPIGTRSSSRKVRRS